MPDENAVLESSPSTGNLTAADVDLDFAAYEKSRQAERIAEAGGPPVETPAEQVPEVKPKADPAPAKVEAPVTEQADKTKPALTAADVKRIADEVAESKLVKPKEEAKEDKFPSLADPQFATVEECEAAQAAWIARHTASEIRKALTDRDREAEATTTQKAETAKRVEAWEKRKEEARARIPDFADLEKQAAAIQYGAEAIPALEFFFESPVGADLFAHYVRNQDELKRLLSLPEAAQLARLAVQEDRIEQSIKANPAPQGKTVSQALPPPRTLAGKASPADDPTEKAVKDDDFAAYEAERRRERARDATTGRYA